MLKNLIILPDGTEIYSGNSRGNAIVSCIYTQCVNDSTELSIGSCCCNELELKLFAKDGLSIAANDEIQYYKVDDSGARTKMGVFRCEKPTVTGTGTYKFVAYDNVSKLDKDLTEWLAALDGWPYTVSTFARMVCEACGLALAVAPMVNAGYEIREFSGSGVTGRMLMQWLGQITCRFIRANANGEIDFAWYADKGKEIATNGDIRYFSGGLSYEDYQVAEIQKVQIQASESDNGTVYPDGSEEELNTYKVTSNYLLTAETGDELKPVAQAIFEQLQGVTYTPCKVSVAATTAINAGDVVHITDRNGVRIKAYVMSKTNKGQKDTLECTGSYKRDSSTATNEVTLKALSGKVLNISKSVEGLRLSAQDTQGRVTEVEVSVEGLTSDVSEIKQKTEDLSNFSSSVTESLTDLQNQIDGAIETWFYNYEPSTGNAPASSWTSTEDKNKHLGDLFYIVDNEDKGGLVYRWALVSGVYGWVLVEDTEVAKALETAAQAQDTADGKRRVFVATPTPPYDVGDLWTDGTDLYRCKTARASGSYKKADWVLATTYTTEATVTSKLEQTSESILAEVSGVKDRVTSLELTDGQVAVTASDSNGKLVTKINSNGTWSSKYTDSSGSVVSSLVFDFTAQQFVFKGKIVSTAGSIGGWDIDSGAISKTQDDSYVGIHSTWATSLGERTIAGLSSTAWRIVAGSANENGKLYFGVTKLGKLAASDAYIEGTVKATAGSIGGWTISGNRLKCSYTDADKNTEKYLFIQAPGSGSTYFIAAGSSDESTWTDAPFRVTKAGVVYCSDLRITGGTININNGVFKVTAGGVLTATGATIEGTIKATSGTIGTWEISGSKIAGGNSSGGYAVMQNPSSGKTTVFAAGSSSADDYTDAPFRVTKAGVVYCSDLRITGGTININNGVFKVTAAGAVTATSATISGVLSAGKGSSLGDFAVDGNSIYNGTWGTSAPDVFMCTGSTNAYTIAGINTAGWTFGSGSTFGVTKSGAMYCTAGRIGNWYIAANALTASSGDIAVTLNSSGVTVTDTSTGTSRSATWSQIVAAAT